MDDYEVYVIDDEDDERTARNHRVVSGGWKRGPGIIRHGGTRTVRPSGWSRGRTVVVDRGPAQSVSRTIIGGLTAGELIEAAAQALAAIQPLPAPPVAAGHAETDVANLVLYQSALATHAKRDEQLRTLGSLVRKLID